MIELEYANTNSGYLMATLKLIFAFLLLTFYSCIQESTKYKASSEAVKLHNKIIPLVNYLDNTDSCKKALLYLDSATTIDNNCFSCYYEKLMFQCSLNQFDNAVFTINNCIRIVPNAHELYLTGGILYFRIGDSISAKKYFQKSLTILNPVLDTVNAKNDDYIMLVGNKAINLIMLGNNKELNELLNKLSDTEIDTGLKKNILAMMHTDKKELINHMAGDKNSHYKAMSKN